MTYSEFHFFWNPKRNGGHRPFQNCGGNSLIRRSSPGQDLERHNRLAPAPLWPCPGDGQKIMVIHGIFMGFSWDYHGIFMGFPWTKNAVGFDVLVLLICSNGKKTSRIRRDLQLEVDITGLIWMEFTLGSQHRVDKPCF